MAPQNRIWRLNDLGHDNASPGFASGIPSESRNAAPAGIPNNPLASSYCQPASAAMASKDGNSSSVKLHHIPTLNLEDVCSSTLKRVLEDFHPIIQRLGFHVLSVSEMCCCGDGLDYAPTRRKKLRKQSPNVWGYNMTRFLGRGRTTHSIHLRLRDPRAHTRLLPWEDVAGTMAHELSHCVHQNHSPAFYKLMEEILEEHATLQAKKAGMHFEPLNRNSVVRPTPSAEAPATVGSMPESGGHRLGGASKGKSRLLDNLQPGHRLGGSKNSTSARQAAAQAAMARAAATRERLLQQTRRMMERAKEPCVIELLDDDDDDCKNTINLERVKPREDLDQKPKAKRKARRALQTQEDSARADPRRKKTAVELIDLTAVSIVDSVATSGLYEEEAVAKPGEAWPCIRCTFRNAPLALVCDMCLSQRT